MSTPKPPRTRAFIVYSHKDGKYLEELQAHLKLFERQAGLDFWDDTKIKPGVKRREEIRKAINSAKVAILLISRDFLASDFIAEKELMPLLEAAEQEGAIILPIIVRPCLFDYTDLAQFQAVNKPSSPLSEMSPGRRDRVWTKVAESVKDALNIRMSSPIFLEAQENLQEARNNGPEFYARDAYFTRPENPFWVDQRLPIYLLLDNSALMQTNEAALRSAVCFFSDHWASDPFNRGRVHISAITFSDQAEQIAWVPVSDFIIPTFNTGRLSALGAALRLVNESLEYDLVPHLLGQKLHYHPLVLLFLGSRPTDRWADEFRRLASLPPDKQCRVFAFALGPDADIDVLSQIAGTALFYMHDLTPERMRGLLELSDWK